MKQWNGSVMRINERVNGKTSKITGEWAKQEEHKNAIQLIGAGLRTEWKLDERMIDHFGRIDGNLCWISFIPFVWIITELLFITKYYRFLNLVLSYVFWKVKKFILILQGALLNQPAMKVTNLPCQLLHNNALQVASLFWQFLSIYNILHRDCNHVIRLLFLCSCTQTCLRFAVASLIAFDLLGREKIRQQNRVVKIG